VWFALRDIPYGATRSYGEIAKAIGSSSAVRAVGSANGANPIAIIIPCHRVIGANGSLTGFGGGLDRKRFLLDLEYRVPALL
jgi:methylated-DNA-[protein]-cysteine S-methyltransferase